jgi:uncharacterized membrane protein required for colicin V production
LTNEPNFHLTVEGGHDNLVDVLDLIIIVVIFLGGWNGYRTGLFRQITRLFGALIAYFIALWIKPYVAPVVGQFLKGTNWVPSQNSLMQLFLGDLSGAVAFSLVFIVTFILLRYASGLLDALFSLPVISTVNRLAGLVIGLVLALVFVYVVTLIGHYVNNQRIQTELEHSAIVQWLDANHWGTTASQLLKKK